MAVEVITVVELIRGAASGGVISHRCSLITGVSRCTCKNSRSCRERSGVRGGVITHS